MNSVSLNVRFTHGHSTLQASWVAENQLAEAQLSKSDFPDAEEQGTETYGRAQLALAQAARQPRTTAGPVRSARVRRG